MLAYSVAIRTLGCGGELFRRELESLVRQTVQPVRVVVYIAEGSPVPAMRVGREEYVPVRRGMMSQRLRMYEEFAEECILMLDDDVELQPDSAEKMLRAVEQNDADCVGADTFSTHRRPLPQRIYAAASNLVFPHRDGAWAFKIRRDGSFSYNCAPKTAFCLSQSCAGNAMMWRRSTYDRLHMEDELWLDDFPFAYNDDMLESYKVYKNGFRLGVLYDSGIVHLDARTASASYRRDPLWMKSRAQIQFVIWWRTCFRPGDTSAAERLCACVMFAFKSLWQFAGVTCLSLARMNASCAVSYAAGLAAGWRFVRSGRFRALRDYAFLKR